MPHTREITEQSLLFPFCLHFFKTCCHPRLYTGWKLASQLFTQKRGRRGVGNSFSTSQNILCGVEEKSWVLTVLWPSFWHLAFQFLGMPYPGAFRPKKNVIFLSHRLTARSGQGAAAATNRGINCLLKNTLTTSSFGACKEPHTTSKVPPLLRSKQRTCRCRTTRGEKNYYAQTVSSLGVCKKPHTTSKAHSLLRSK